jgi:hypothetical protein
MMQRSLFTGLLIGMLTLNGGCAARKAAEDLAAETGRLALEYEHARDRKVQAEKKFYADQKETLRQILGGTSGITNPKPQDLNVTKTVVYGRIVTATERDAISLAESLIASPGIPQVWSGLTDFLEKGLKDDWESYLEARRRQEQLNTDLVKGLIIIDQQTEQLESMRNNLLELGEEPTLKARAKQLFDLGAAVRKQLEEKEKKQP